MVAKVKKIVIEMGKKEVVLTPAEARELRNALNEVLGNDIRVQPVVIERERWHPPLRPTWARVDSIDSSGFSVSHICATQDNTARLLDAR